MAEYRQIECLMWKDNWFIDLDANEKLLFVYLLSNESTSVAGIYEISMKVMSFENSIDLERVKNILNKFIKEKKIRYEDGILWVLNSRKYQRSNSPKVETRIKLDVSRLSDTLIKNDYIRIYSIDTVSIPYLKSDSETETEMETEMETETDSSVSLRSDIFNLYSKYIGEIKPIIEPTLIRADEEYDPAWIPKAFEIMHGNGKKSWSYVEGILKNWQSNGYKPGRNGKPKVTDRTSEDARRKYAESVK